MNDLVPLTLVVHWRCKACDGRFGLATWVYGLDGEILAVFETEETLAIGDVVSRMLEPRFPCATVWPWCIGGQVGGIGAATRIRARLQDEYGACYHEDELI